jgi:tetratricopeptide (TPR) repeat protein
MKKLMFCIFLTAIIRGGTCCYSQKTMDWTDTVRIDSVNYKKYVEVSKKLLNQFKFQQARILSGKLYQYDTTNIECILHNAEVLASLNNIQKTIDFYKKAIEMDTLNIYPYLNLGEFYQKNNAFPEAIGCYLPVVNRLDSINYFALKQTGICMLELNNPMMFKLALNYLIRALQVNPYDLSLSFRIANTLNVIRQFDQSIEVCQKGLEIDSLNTKLLSVLAYAQYNNSDFKHAILNFEKILAKGDTTSFIIKNLGFTYYRDNQFNSAKLYLDKTIKLLKTEGQVDYDVYLFLSDISLQMNDSKAAFGYLQKADSLRYPPADLQSKLYKGMAMVYNAGKDWTNGARYFEQACKIFPEDKTTLLLLAYQYDYLKNKEKAYGLYNEFISSADPNSFQKELIIVKQRIANLKEDLFFEGKVKK